MRDYGIVSPRFWIGETGRKLRKLPDAQRIAMYLLTAPMADMTGVFYCPVATILNDVGAPCEPLEAPLKGLERGYEGAPKGLIRASEGPSKGLPSPSEGAYKGLQRGFEGASDPLARGFQGASKGYEPPLEGHQRALEGVKRALLALQALGFCYYDFESEYVFVIEMARWQIAPKLKASDNRAKGLRKIVENLPNPMRARFIARYNEDFSLGFDEKEVEKMLSESKPLASPFEGPWEALRSQDQEQDQDQEQEQDISSRVSNETLSSANANASESVEENQTNLFDSIEEPCHNLAEKSDAHPDDVHADVQPESASNSLQTMESNPADELSRKPAKRKTAKSLADSLQKPEGVGDDLWRDWVAHKKKVSKDCTQRMVNAIVREAAAAGITTAQAMEMQLEHGWVGFEARYLTGKQSLAGPGRTPDAKNHFGNTKVAAHLKNEAMRFTDDYYADANRPDGTPDWGC